MVRTEMQNWKHELDALVAETLAFVKSVVPAAIEIKKKAPFDDPTSAETNTSKNVPASPPQRPKLEEPDGFWAKKERDEIGRRLASFKAHQERWIREREEYANSTLNRIKSSKPD